MGASIYGQNHGQKYKIWPKKCWKQLYIYTCNILIGRFQLKTKIIVQALQVPIEHQNIYLCNLWNKMNEPISTESTSFHNLSDWIIWV